MPGKSVAQKLYIREKLHRSAGECSQRLSKDVGGTAGQDKLAFHSCCKVGLGQRQ